MTQQNPTSSLLPSPSNPNGTHPPPSAQPIVPILAPTAPMPPTAAVVPPPPVVPHDVKPHIGQGVEYARLLVKLKSEFPETHPTVIAAVAAIENADAWNSRRGRSVVHEWPAAHEGAVEAVKKVMSELGTGAALPAPSPTAVANAPTPSAPAVAGAPTPGHYRVDFSSGTPVLTRNGLVIRATPEIVGLPAGAGSPMNAFAAAQANANANRAKADDRPTLLYFGHPNYWEALKFVFRGRHPDISPGLPLINLVGGDNGNGAEIVGLAVKGRQVDVRIKFDDAPVLVDEAEHVQAQLVKLVEAGFLEANDVGGMPYLRLSRDIAEKMGTYTPYVSGNAAPASVDPPAIPDTEPPAPMPAEPANPASAT